MFTFVKSGKAFQQPNTEQGIAALIEQLLVVQPELVVLEATGGMEVPAAAALSSAALAVAIVNPRGCARLGAHLQVKSAKTDAIDAAVLAPNR